MNLVLTEVESDPYPSKGQKVLFFFFIFTVNQQFCFCCLYDIFFFKQLNSYNPILEKLCHIIHWHYLSTWVLILIYIPYEFLALILRRHYAWDRTVGSVVNRTFCPCRGSKFDSQHLHGSPQPNVTSVLGS